jgi:dTDP-glucose 4,6-dehydratase
LDKGNLGETYNVGGDSEKTNIEVVQLICSILDELRPDVKNGSYSRLVTHVQDRPGHDRRYAIDCSKIKTELGWSQQETFESGIRKTVEWYLNNSEWVNAVLANKYTGERLGVQR